MYINIDKMKTDDLQLLGSPNLSFPMEVFPTDCGSVTFGQTYFCLIDVDLRRHRHYYDIVNEPVEDENILGEVDRIMSGSPNILGHLDIDIHSTPTKIVFYILDPHVFFDQTTPFALKEGDPNGQLCAPSLFRDKTFIIYHKNLVPDELHYRLYMNTSNTRIDIDPKIKNDGGLLSLKARLKRRAN